MRTNGAMLSGMGKSGKFWTFDRAFTVANGIAGLALACVGAWFAIATYYRDQPAPPAVVAAPEPSLMPPWWAVALLVAGVALLTTQLALGVIRWRRWRLDNDLRDDPNWVDRLEIVTGRTFMNSTVPIDDKRYISCKFQNVTFVYNGGPFAIENCEFGLGMTFRTDNKQIRRAAELMTHLGIAKTHVLLDSGLVSHEEYLARGGNKIYNPVEGKPPA